jgi:hypothetical protein
VDNGAVVDPRVELSPTHFEWSRRLFGLPPEELEEHARYIEKSASELGVWERGGYVPLQPFIVSNAASKLLHNVYSGIKQLQVEHAVISAKGDLHRLADVVGWRHDERWFLGAKRPLAAALGAGRADIFISGGRPKFLEVNIGTCLNGNISSAVLPKVFLSSLFGAEMSRLHAMQECSYIDEMIQWVQRYQSGERSNVALLGFPDETTEGSLKWADEQIARFASHGISSEFVPVGEAEVADNALYWRNKRYGAAIRYFMVSAKVAEHLDFFRALEYATDTILFGSYVSQLFTSKSLLADLYQDERTTAEQRRLLSYLPWTARLREGFARKAGERVDPIDWAVQHRADTVLKPGNQFGSRGVVVGRLMSDSDWCSALDTAVRDGSYVVQELVLPDTWESMYWHIDSESLVRVESPVLLGQFGVDGADGGCHVQQPIKGSEVDLLSRDREVSLGCVMSV